MAWNIETREPAKQQLLLKDTYFYESAEASTAVPTLG